MPQQRKSRKAVKAITYLLLMFPAFATAQDFSINTSSFAQVLNGVDSSGNYQATTTYTGGVLTVHKYQQPSVKLLQGVAVFVGVTLNEQIAIYEVFGQAAGRTMVYVNTANGGYAAFQSAEGYRLFGEAPQAELSHIFD